MLCSGGAGRQARAHLVLPERIWYNSIVLAQPVSESLSPFRAADGRKPFVATIEFYERGGIVKGFLNNRRVSCTLSALCFIALGVFLVFWPELSRIWICRLLGAALLVSGGVYVVSHFARAKGAAAVFQYDLILGAVLAVVGVWLLTTPDLIVAFLQYILGLILIVHGVIDLQGALNLRAGHARHWWPAFLIALITLALGALILWNPFASINALLMLVGIALIYDGISDILILFQLTRTFRKVQQGVEASVEAAEVIEGEGTVEQ